MDELRRIQGGGHMRGCVPSRAMDAYNAADLYSKVGCSPHLVTGCMSEGRVMSVRARVVRDGIRSVAEVLGLTKPAAIRRIARQLGRSGADVLEWAPRGIRADEMFRRWCRAVEDLEATGIPWIARSAG